MRPGRAIFGKEKKSSGSGLDAKGAEVVGRHQLREDALGRARRREAQSESRRITGEVCERVVVLAQVNEIRIRNRKEVSELRGVLGVERQDRDELVGFVDRKGTP